MKQFLTRRKLLRLTLLTSLGGALHARSSAATEPAVDDDYSRGDIFQTFVVDPWKAENDNSPHTLALPADFIFPDAALYDCKVDHPGGVCRTDTSMPRKKDMIFGIDINHYTADDFSFSDLRNQEVKFVQMKATQGKTVPDAKFKHFWTAAGRLSGDARVYRGAYHFLTASASGREQAEWFLANLESAGGLKAADMAPGVDLEWDVYRSTGKTDHWAGKGEQFIMDTVLSCLEHIERQTGRVPILYTGKSWFGKNTVSLSRFKELARYPLWVFDYDPTRKIEERPVLPDSAIRPALWQFTASARVPGSYKGAVDASVFYGTDAEFKKTFGIK
jgi:lysozyme